MSTRSAKFVSALVASMLAGANLTAVAENGAKPADTKPVDIKSADNCLSDPKGAAPAGSHWYYRLDRATKRKCWYAREGTSKTAKAAPAQPDASPPAESADAAPPPPPRQQPAVTPSVANARAEWPSPQASVTQAPAAAASDNGQRAITPDAARQSSPVSSRWPGSSTDTSASNNDKPAAADPAPSAQEDTAPAPQPAATSAAPAATDANLDRQATSTQMLLIVMAGALALAGLIGAMVFRFGRTRTPPYEIRDEWRAPWDPVPAERPRSKFAGEEVPMRRPQTPAPRPADRMQPPADVAREEPAPAITEQQIAEMLARLARSATR
jgi:hypothetical protein